MEPKKGMAALILASKKPPESAPSDPTDDVQGGAMNEGAQALIDAVSSGSVASVASAFKDLYELCASGSSDASAGDDFA